MAAARPAPAAAGPSPAEGEPLLSLRGLRTSVTAGGEVFDVVSGLSLDIYPNEILCLVGESGCGKSITALSIMRLLPTPPVRVRGGSVLYRGQDLLQLDNRRMRRLRSDSISMIFQDPLTSLDPVFTAGDVISEVVRAHRSVSKSEARRMAGEALS